MKFTQKLILASCAFFAANINAISLHDALENLYKNNDIYKKNVQDVKINLEALPKAMSAFLPDIAAQVSLVDTDNFNKPVGPNDAPSGKQKNLSKSLVLSQNIFNGGMDSAALEDAKNSFLVTKAKFLDIENKLLLEAVQAYLSALEARDNLLMERETVEFYYKKLTSIRQSFAVGQATKTDIAQAEALYNASLGRESGASALKLEADLEFKQFFGVDAQDLKWPEAPLFDEKECEKFLQNALKYNPAIKSAKYALKSSNSKVKIATGALLPRLNLKAQVSDVESRSPSAANNPLAQMFKSAKSEMDYSLSLQLDIPIFKGGAEHASIREYKHAQRKAVIEYHSALSANENQIRTTWQKYFASRKQYHSTTETVAAYEMVLSGLEKEELFGNKSLLDVLQARKELSDTKKQNIASHKAHLLVGYSLKSFVGNLSHKALKLKVERFDIDKEFKKKKYQLIGF